MLKSTRIIFEKVSEDQLRLKAQPEGYTVPTNLWVECYNRWADASAKYYKKWNAEFEKLYPDYVYSTYIEDMPEYAAYISERLPDAWNAVNKGKIIMRSVSNCMSDWHWY